MTDGLLVGVDIGTTRVKAVVFDLAGRELGSAATATPWTVDGAHVEADGREVADAALSVAATALGGVEGDQRVLGVGVTGMAEAGVLVDRHGDPVSPIIAWHDPRGDVDRVLRELPDFCVRTGMPPIPVASIFKLPALLAGAEGRAVRWLNVPEWIVWSMGGEQFAEMSLAGRTGLQDLHTGRWWPEALGLLGADESLLPGEARIGTDGAGCARVAPVEDAVLAVAGHDHQVAAFGEGAAQPGHLFDSLGTAEALLRVVEPPITDQDVTTVTDTGGSVGRTVVPGHLAVIAGFRTGQILERISTLIGCTDRAARLELSRRAVSREVDATLSVDIDGGLLTIAGVGDTTDPEDLWRAAIAAADRGAGEAIARLDQLFGPATDVVIGGGWLHDPTMSATKDARFPAHRRTTTSEPGAAGAASIAGISAGVLDGPFTHTTTAEGGSAHG